MSDIDPESVRFEYEYPYPPLPAEKIARIEQQITEELVRPYLRGEYDTDD